jgi:hypothetical protein
VHQSGLSSTTLGRGQLATRLAVCCGQSDSTTDLLALGKTRAKQKITRRRLGAGRYRGRVEAQAASYARQSLEGAAAFLTSVRPASRGDLLQLRGRLESSRSYFDRLKPWTGECSGESSETLDDLREKLDELASADSMVGAAPHVEQAIGDLNSLLAKPGSTVTDRFLRTAAATAPRPVRLALDGLIEQIGHGVSDSSRERLRAIELAFQTAVVVLPQVMKRRGGPTSDLAPTLRDLQSCSGEFIAAMIRQEYSGLLSGDDLAAADAAAAALEAAGLLAFAYDEDAATAVADHAATTLRLAFRAGVGQPLTLTRHLVEDILDAPHSARMIVERRPSVSITRLG